jgi:hypothetical protein
MCTTTLNTFQSPRGNQVPIQHVVNKKMYWHFQFGNDGITPTMHRFIILKATIILWTEYLNSCATAQVIRLVVEENIVICYRLYSQTRQSLLHTDKHTWPSPSSRSYSIMTLSSSPSSSSTAVESSLSVSSSAISYSDSRVPSVLAFRSPS